MAIALTLAQYLSDKHIPYDVMLHRMTAGSARTAQVAHVPGDALAKGVVCRDDEGYLLAVVPSTHQLDVEGMSRLMGHPVSLAEEDELSSLFGDCDLGAVPISGEPYGLRVVWDDNLAARSEVYFEGGDHMTLIEVGHDGFETLMGSAPHGAIGRHA